MGLADGSPRSDRRAFSRRRGLPHRVASGFDETWGSERNSSRSIVPELSFYPWSELGSEPQDDEKGVRKREVRGARYFVQFHKPLPQPVHLITVNCRGQSAAARLRRALPGSSSYNWSLV